MSGVAENNGIGRVSRGEDLEKKIYKSALIETVDTLNKNLDSKQDRRRKKHDEGNGECVAAHPSSARKNKTNWRKSGETEALKEDTSRGKNPKTRRGDADMHGIVPSKQKRNGIKKMQGTRAEKSSSPDDTRGNGMQEEPRKMSRKERRVEKIRTRGKGMSSKEYYEKFIKKSRDSEDEDVGGKRGKETIPSKRKGDFPRDEKKGGKRRR